MNRPSPQAQSFVATQARVIADAYSLAELRQLRSELRIIIDERTCKSALVKSEYGRLATGSQGAGVGQHGPRYLVKLNEEVLDGGSDINQ